MDESQIFPKLDAALAIGSAYLTERVRDDSKLPAFEAELGKLKVEPGIAREAIRKHAEWLHHSGRLKSEDVVKVRAVMEPAAADYANRCFQMLLSRYAPVGRETDEHAARLAALTDAVRMAQARGGI